MPAAACAVLRSTPAPAPADSEAPLRARLQAGEPAAFEELVNANAGRMLAVARRLLRDEEEALDAVQEALLQAFLGLDRFQGGSRLSTWLHRIVVNASLMRLRSRRRRREEPIEDLLPQFAEDGHRLDVQGPWPEDAHTRLETLELRGAVREAIDRLPEKHRTVLLLRDIEGLANDEVASLLGIRPEAAKMRLHRARQALVTLLDPVMRGKAA